jgi:hypothetical protein
VKKKVVIGGLLVLLCIGVVAGRIGWCYVANSELQSDIKDLTAQNTVLIGLKSPETEEDLRSEVIKAAKNHGIQLEPEQVTVKQKITHDEIETSISAEYEARVNLLVYSYGVHFTPESSQRRQIE